MQKVKAGETCACKDGGKMKPSDDAKQHDPSMFGGEYRYLTMAEMERMVGEAGVVLRQKSIFFGDVW